MTPEAQRIAIAQHLFPDFPVYRDSLSGELRHRYPHRGVDESGPAHDYLSDLTACHEMEEVLSESQGVAYVGHLQDILNIEEQSHYDGGGICQYDLFLIAHATAAQRAEAFLKTIGKWEESPNPQL